MNETVYISFPKNTQVNNARVSIGDCASVWCEDAHITARVKAITFFIWILPFCFVLGSIRIMVPAIT